MKKILLNLLDEDYRKLEWLATKLGMNISAVMRALIPNVKVPEVKIIKDEDIYKAGPNDLVEVITPFDRDLLDNKLDQLKKKGWAKTLANEIKKQLVDKDGEHLTIKTRNRLSRWIHP
jgi:hypothetical protein